MRIIDPGHIFSLDNLDDTSGTKQLLTFVKREGKKYPGNKGHYPGTNCQEVIRALITRLRYLNAQDFDQRNNQIILSLQQDIWLLEQWAAERHGRDWNFEIGGIELFSTCSSCGHIDCSCQMERENK